MLVFGCEGWLCYSSTSTFFFFLGPFLTRLCSKNDDLRCLLSHYYDCVVTIKARWSRTQMTFDVGFLFCDHYAMMNLYS